MNTEQVTDTKPESIIDKLYDKAYEQGFKHCKLLFEKMAPTFSVAKISEELEKYITEKFPKLEKTITP